MSHWVNRDCRPGDVIRLLTDDECERRNARVIAVYRNAVRLDWGDERRQVLSYERLAERDARYVGQMSPSAPSTPFKVW